MSNIPFKNISQNKSSDENDLKELLTELNNLVPKFVDSSTFKRHIFDMSDENHYTETFIKYFLNEWHVAYLPINCLYIDLVTSFRWLF